MAHCRLTPVIVAALLVATPAVASTWRVAKDESGDFAIIQEAVDAAAAGDTISIGPGRYEEYSFFFHHSWDVYGCVNVTKDRLVFVGDDALLTIIGFPEFIPHEGWSISGFNCIEPLTLNIQGITISGVYESIHFEGTEIDVANCIFLDSRRGIESWGSLRNNIESCNFTGLFTSISLFAGSNNTTISDCTINPDPEVDSQGVLLIHAMSCVVEHCTITGGVEGVQAEQYSELILRNCNIDSGYGGAVIILDGTTAELYDNYLRATQIVLIYDGEDASLIATGNVIDGGAYATIQSYSITMNMHGNHILSGGGYAIEALMGGSSPIVLDLTENYWGTDNAGEIATLILDHNDFDQYDPSHWVIVDYEPFAPHEIETESTTWGAVKTLFR